MQTWVGNRRVIVNTKETQTVKICTSQNERGRYEKYYRIPSSYVMRDNEISTKLQEFKNIEELEHWLINDRKAARERDKETGSSTDIPQPKQYSSAPLSENRNEMNASHEVFESNAHFKTSNGKVNNINSINYSPDDDPGLLKIKNHVEQSLDYLVQEFLEYPYLHRVEHSLHAQLFHIMTMHPELSQRVPIGNSRKKTQLIHKEWPANSIDKQVRRGNFDIGILTPYLLSLCQDEKLFRNGELFVPIAIEIGLDCDFQHLKDDAEKLVKCKPRYGYLIHMIRDTPQDDELELFISDIEKGGNIKTVYVRVAGQQIAFKKVNDKEINKPII